VLPYDVSIPGSATSILSRGMPDGRKVQDGHDKAHVKAMPTSALKIVSSNSLYSPPRHAKSLDAHDMLHNTLCIPRM
jgi:hypothetical protein